MKEQIVELKTEGDIVIARQAGREMARDLGFGSADQTRLATAISELTRNALHFANEGICVVADESDQNMLKIRVTVEDHGPGILDIDQAMEDGYSTGSGLGAGLPGAKRVVQAFDVESVPGHTVITIAMVRRRL